MPMRAIICRKFVGARNLVLWGAIALSAGIALSSISASANSLSVTGPDGGADKTLPILSNVSVTWTGGAAGTWAQLWLMNAANNTGTLVTNVSISAGNLNWKLPASLGCDRKFYFRLIQGGSVADGPTLTIKCLYDIRLEKTWQTWWPNFNYIVSVYNSTTSSPITGPATITLMDDYPSGLTVQTASSGPIAGPATWTMIPGTPSPANGRVPIELKATVNAGTVAIGCLIGSYRIVGKVTAKNCVSLKDQAASISINGVTYKDENAANSTNICADF